MAKLGDGYLAKDMERCRTKYKDAEGGRTNKEIWRGERKTKS